MAVNRRVKIFYAVDYATLEDDINDFLKSNEVGELKKVYVDNSDNIKVIAIVTYIPGGMQ